MNLIHYVRDRHGNPLGALVAFPVDANFHISWSYCSKRDEFTKAEAILWARLRYYATPDMPGVMPHKLRRALPEFISRCERYYKGMGLGTIRNSPKRKKDYLVISMSGETVEPATTS